jgi:hypothetical protein
MSQKQCKGMVGANTTIMTSGSLESNGFICWIKNDTLNWLKKVLDFKSITTTKARCNLLL